MIPKPALVTGLVLIVAAIAIVLPWYPLTTSQVVPQTQSYTTQFEVPTTSYQTVTAYTLPGPVEVQSVNYGPPTPPCSAGWYYCKPGGFQSQPFNLQSGVSYTVTVNECQACGMYVEQEFGGYNTYASITGSGEASFVAPASGSYEIYASSGADGSTNPGMLNAVLISGSIPQSVELAQTLTTYSTTSVTQYSQAAVSPYTILGVLPSAAIIGILVIVVLFFALQNRRTTHGPKQATLGQFVKASTSCIKCGAELPPASDFCNKCGTKQTG